VRSSLAFARDGSSTAATGLLEVTGCAVDGPPPAVQSSSDLTETGARFTAGGKQNSAAEKPSAAEPVVSDDRDEKAAVVGETQEGTVRKIAQLDGAADDDTTTQSDNERSDGSASMSLNCETTPVTERERVHFESPTSATRHRSRRTSERGHGNDDAAARTR
jgi:hypothetical protein